MDHQLDQRKLLSNAFDKIHEQMALLRSHLETSPDATARELLVNMECGLMAPMRRMRLHMDIPYSWSETKATKSRINSKG